MKESIPGCEVILASAKNSSGNHVRVVITRPAGLKGKAPALMFLPWLSCVPVEAPDPKTRPQSVRIFQEIASKSGFVTIRVEKPGLMDSEGPPCRDCDFATELSGYEDAWNRVKELDYVDQNSIYLMGESLGGATAALVSRGKPVKGLIVIGTFSKSWYEHMLEIEARKYTLMGKPKEEVSRLLGLSREFYKMYLVEKMTPGDIVAQHPEFKEVWDDEPAHQYGRPAKFYQQIQDMQVRNAFEALRCPVLAIWGEYDWIMGRDDHEWIAETANRIKKGNGRFVMVQGMDHNQIRYKNAADAFTESNGARQDDSLTAVLEWLSQQESKKP
jgi:pimeloyl-ACP methyl ester carboxylesterase